LTDARGVNAPTTPFQRSTQPMGAAAGGRLRPILICFFSKFAAVP